MTEVEFSRRSVWSPWLRLSHWAMAVLLTALLVSAWLYAHAPTLAIAALDYHIIFGQLLILALGLRLFLLFFGRTADHWRDCLPGRRQGLLDSLRFYLSRGHTPLPNWYAHNPLWGPLYLLLFGMLVVEIGLGIAAHKGLLLAGMPVAGLHAGIGTFIFFFSLLHVAAVLLHDWRGGNSDISAMLHGYRLFRREPPPAAPLGMSSQDVSLDILATTGKPGPGTDKA